MKTTAEDQRMTNSILWNESAKPCVHRTRKKSNRRSASWSEKLEEKDLHRYSIKEAFGSGGPYVQRRFVQDYSENVIDTIRLSSALKSVR